MKDVEGCALGGRARRRGGAAAGASGWLSKKRPNTDFVIVFSFLNNCSLDF